MEGFGPATYGERIADVYDEWYPPPEELEAAAALDDLAGGGPVLELGVGTGHLALALAARGLKVHGIDASPAMLARLAAKPGAEAVTTSIGDFADVDVGAEFAVVVVTFSTFFNLTSQEAQVRCFARVAERLAPGGVFVVEAFVPDPTIYTRDQAVVVSELTPDRVALQVAHHDPVAQTVTATTIAITERGTRLYPVAARNVPPAELDLMARLAGLRLRDRWADWRRTPFASGDRRHIRHISVYGP